MRLGMVQMRSEVKNRDKNVARALEYIDLVVHQGAELVLLPEFFNTEYFAQYWDYAYFNYAEHEDGYTLTHIREKARAHQVHIAATIYEYEAPGVYFDTLFMVGPDGQIVGKYRKTHPAAMRSIEKIYYRAGNGFPVWEINGINVGAVICYDHVFPETIRSATVKGAELVLGPFATKGIPAWESLMVTRAFENGVYMAPCNKVGEEDAWTSSGGSMVVDPNGTILHQANQTEDETFVIDVLREQVMEARIRFPFLRDRRPEAYSAITTTDEIARGL